MESVGVSWSQLALGEMAAAAEVEFIKHQPERVGACRRVRLRLRRGVLGVADVEEAAEQLKLGDADR